MTWELLVRAPNSSRKPICLCCSAITRAIRNWPATSITLPAITPTISTHCESASSDAYQRDTGLEASQRAKLRYYGTVGAGSFVELVRVVV